MAALQADESLKFSTCYAIEKSDILRGQLPADVLVIGTDFREQSLISKEVDVTFCNPPYSEFVVWAEKIIRESASKVIYLVIPQRWEQDARIADALAYRAAKAHKVGEFTFEDAEDRKARAKVHLLRISLKENKDDAFERLFKEQFADLCAQFDDKRERGAATADSKRKEQFAGLVVGESYPEAMVALYVAELAKINRNYEAASVLDAELLRELDINPEKIMACLMARLKGLRLAYWQELFEKMGPITNRLTAVSRKRLLDQLQKHTAVDFTVSNIYAVIVWALKNANAFVDAQLVQVYELMVDKANVLLYKSNHKTFVQSRWGYQREDQEENSHYALDYRIVIHRVGGIAGGWSKYQAECHVGLDERAYDFLGDLCVIAHNLGFDSTDGRAAIAWRGTMWAANESHEFFYRDKRGQQVLFSAKAFGNGNLHLKFSRRFMLALNVEHGRLRGWLRNKEEAATELEPAAAAVFKTNHKFLPEAPTHALLCA